jgi:hypothetical protein
MEERPGGSAHLRSATSAIGWTRKKNPGLRETVETIQTAGNQILRRAVVRKSRVELAENGRDLTHKTDEKWDKSQG